jgi:hypothetical protein
VHDLVAWCGFFGAWFLVAGPIYQAALELQEETFERDDVARAAATLPPEDAISSWWWLFPPVYYVKARARTQRRRAAVMDALTPLQREQMIGFVSKAHGWFMVALGAFLIAIKETWELREAYEWPIAVFWVLVVVAAVAAVGHTARQMLRNDRARGSDRAEQA